MGSNYDPSETINKYMDVDELPPAVNTTPNTVSKELFLDNTKTDALHHPSSTMSKKISALDNKMGT